jgi:asparagine synthase (glutamine-hydrolysing)
MATSIADRFPDGAPGKRFLQSMCLDEWFLGTLSAGWKKRIFNPGFRAEIEGVNVSSSFQNPPDGGDADYLSKYLYWETKNYLPDDVLVKVDRASMANSLETRTLFLGHELVEFAATIPSSFKIRNGQTKHILKRTMRDLLPAEILGRGKWGFALPVALWFRNELKEVIGSLVHVGAADEVFDRKFMKLVLDQHLSGARDHHKLLWSFMMFRLWERQWAGWKPPLFVN